MSETQTRRQPSARQTLGVVGGLGAFLLLMFGLLLFMGYSNTTEQSGMLWWQSTNEVPLDERIPYLQGAIVCWVFAAVLGGVTLSVTLRGTTSRLKRYGPILKGVESMPVQQIAGIVNVKPARVYKDLQRMIDSGDLADVYIDYQAGQVVNKKYTPDRSHKTVATCPSCGARSEVIIGVTRSCSYCAQPLPL